MHFALGTTLAALFAVAAADLSVTLPTSDLWWVAKSANELRWTCKDSSFQTFTVLIANKNPQILVSPMAIISIQNNFDCSKTITQDQANQAAGTGYTILLANPLNNTDVYATSQEFEIKALGATYPSIPADTDASTAGATSGTATATDLGAAASATGTKSSALELNAKTGVWGVLGALVVGAVVA